MPYEISVENNGARIITRYYGKLIMPEIDAAYNERFTDIEKIKKYRLLINDFTDVSEVSTDGLDVPKLARYYLWASTHNPDVVVVNIMPTDLEFGLGRMWEGYVSDMPWEENVVRTREEARCWLVEGTDQEVSK